MKKDLQLILRAGPVHHLVEKRIVKENSKREFTIEFTRE